MSKVQFRSVWEESDAASIFIEYFGWIDKMIVSQQLGLSEFF